MDKEIEIIGDIYSHIRNYGKGPDAEQYLADHYDSKVTIEKMESDGVLRKDDLGRYVVPVRQLKGMPFWEKDLKLANKIIARLAEFYRSDVNRILELSEIVSPDWSLIKERDIQRVLGYLEELYYVSAMKLDNKAEGRVILSVRPKREVLDSPTIEAGIENLERKIREHRKSLPTYTQTQGDKMKNKVFISHAVNDKALVDQFVDLLDTGTALTQNDIFCSSVKGMGVPNYDLFVKAIQKRLQEAELAIVILSPNYLESSFCNCELGAAWFVDKNCFVLVVPPLGFAEVKSVMTGRHVGMIGDSSVLDELRDYIFSVLKIETNTARWNEKKEAFLASASKIIKALPAPSKVLAEKHVLLQKECDAKARQLAELQAENARLTATVNKLAALKDKPQVEEVLKETSGEDERFEALVDAAYSALNKIKKRIVREVIFEHIQGKPYKWPGWGHENEREELEAAVSHAYLRENEDGVELNEEDPSIEAALGAIGKLSEFIEENASSDFLEKYRAEEGFNADVCNKRFWERHFL